MEPNNRNNRNRGDKNRRRGGGMWSIVLWALLLTIGVNYLSVMLDQARTAESSCEIAYSELVELVEEGRSSPSNSATRSSPSRRSTALPTRMTTASAMIRTIRSSPPSFPTRRKI